MTSHSTGTNASGATESTTVSEQVMNRLSQNDVALASDHPMQSIVKIARGDGYAQYGGLPFVDDRKAMEWPGPMEGTFIPKDFRPPSGSSPASSPPRPPSGPTLTTELIGDLKLGGPPPLPPPSDRSNRKKRKGGDR
jgi:hypothetical protein